MTSFPAKTIFITGATSGFGLASAKRFAKEGWKIIATGRRKERLEALARELPAGGAHIIPLDVCDNSAVCEAVAGLPPAFACIDALFNNAGLALGLEGAHQARLEDWERMVDTNIKGLLYCTRAILPGMVARKSGHILNMGSVAARYPYPGGNAYGATKAFVDQFSLNLRADLTGTGVRVTCLNPGMAETEFSEVRFKGDAAKAANVYKGVHALSGEDIAEAVYWCASLPSHVNINTIEIMPTQQAFGPFSVQRETI